MMLRPSLLFAAAAIALAVLPAASSAQRPVAADSAAWWRETARTDLAAARQIMDTRFIVALNDPGPEWDRFLGDLTRAAERDVERVHDYASYQSVIKKFITAFDDAHVRATFPKQQQRRIERVWPGFFVRYERDHFRVVASERSDVKVGSPITGCDFKPIDQVLTEIMPYEQVRPHLELESTRTALGRLLFVDAATSLRPRPTSCRIGGYDVALNWQPVASDKLARLDSIHGTYRTRDINIENWGRNNAWVRIPTMSPSGESARAFAQIIAQAPSIRNKDVIVIDVRGNGGGGYNWFAGFLDSLYGPAYAQYHARARVQFANIMSNMSPNQGAAGSGRGAGRSGGGAAAQQAGGRGRAGATEQVRAPADPILNAGNTVGSRAGAHGTTLRIIPAADADGSPTGPVPPNPVRARVFLLTDNGCGSACISFTDEMRRFPGVLQIGRDTYVDSYPGSAQNYPLPSGEASISAPNMTREVRQRGNNFAWKADVYFDGDVRDTEAIRKWITDVVLKK